METLMLIDTAEGVMTFYMNPIAQVEFWLSNINCVTPGVVVMVLIYEKNGDVNEW